MRAAPSSLPAAVERADACVQAGAFEFDGVAGSAGRESFWARVRSLLADPSLRTDQQRCRDVRAAPRSLPAATGGRPNAGGRWQPLSGGPAHASWPWDLADRGQAIHWQHQHRYFLDGARRLWQSVQCTQQAQTLTAQGFHHLVSDICGRRGRCLIPASSGRRAGVDRTTSRLSSLYSPHLRPSRSQSDRAGLCRDPASDRPQVGHSSGAPVLTR